MKVLIVKIKECKTMSSLTFLTSQPLTVILPTGRSGQTVAQLVEEVPEYASELVLTPLHSTVERTVMI